MNSGNGAKSTLSPLFLSRLCNNFYWLKVPGERKHRSSLQNPSLPRLREGAGLPRDTPYGEARVWSSIDNWRYYDIDFDTSDNSFNKKVREAVTKKFPNMTMPLDRFVDPMRRAVSQRIMDNFEDVEV